MRSTVQRFLGLISILLVGHSVCCAQMVPSPTPPLQSIDLPATNSWAVVTGSIVEVIRSDREWDGLDVKVLIKELLKGDHQEKQITVKLQKQKKELEAWKQNSTLLLLAIPWDPDQISTAIDLSDKNLSVMSADLERLRSPEEVIRVIKERIRATRGIRKIRPFSILVPESKVGEFDKEAYRNRYGWPKGFAYLDVPVDERLEKYAHKELRAKEIPQRINGIQALGLFRSDENIALLQTMLKDEEWEDSYYARDHKLWHVRFNNVRREAFSALQSLGVTLDPPVSLVPEAEQGQVIGVEMDEATPTEAGVIDLASYPNLTDLYLANGKLSKNQYAVIGQLKSLKGLYLESTNVTDADLPALASLPNLRYLALGNTEITDAGLLELAKFKSLKKVDLGPRVTEKGIAALRKLRPDLKLRSDDLAYLQVLNPRRVEVPIGKVWNYVLPIGTANEGAMGLRAYVLIFPKDSVAQLSALLAEHQPAALRNPRGGFVSGPDHSPAPVGQGNQFVDTVEFSERTNQGFDQYLDIRAAPGERMLVVIRNVDPRH